MEQNEERYDIQGKLGEGGRGTVYLARDRQLNRTVAIKRLMADKDDAEEAYQAVLRESRALSALNSPHIVRVFDVGQDEEGPYVVMEHLNGKTLQEVVTHAPLVEGDFFQIAEQGLEALIAAHEVHLLHRDIKPGNLMLNWLPSGRFNLKLLDFGLAKFSETPSVQTIAYGKSVMGSIYFMAPEQFERRPLDARTDLYSLGCVFFYSLTGDYPFNGESVAAVMVSHLHGKHPDLHTLRPDLSPALCDWVTHFIALNPDNRPSSAQQALEAFQEAKDGTFALQPRPPIEPSLPSPPPLFTPPTNHPPLLQTATHPIPTATTGVVPTATTGHIPTITQPTLTSASSGIPTWLMVLIGLCLAAAILLGLIVLNSGDPSIPPPNPASRNTDTPPAKPAGPDQAFLNRDKDKDGIISLQEFFTSTDPQVQNTQSPIFRRLDTDSSDGLSPEEFSKR